jgi:anaerobic selenocysteine-containing dehydrogenase
MESKSKASNGKKVVKAVCHRNCPSICFIDVEVENGRITATRGSMESPVTRGVLCPRGMGDPQRVYSEDRVLYPHIRKDHGLVRVSWEEALQLASKRLEETIRDYGRESVLLYDYPGNQGFLSWQYSQRLWRAIGATRTDGALCSNSGHTGIALHYGLTYGVGFDETIDYPAVVFWGNNVQSSYLHLWLSLLKAKKERDITFVSVDPRRSETSRNSDLWIAPRPGSDVALCYGVARYLIENDKIDKPFINSNSVGFDEYRKEAIRWTPDRVERVTKLNWGIIEEFSELISRKRPVAFLIGLGLNKSDQGAESVRAVSLLPALLGQHRGFHYSDGRGRYDDWSYINGSKMSKLSSRVVNQVSVGQMLMSGEFKYIFIKGTNPAVTLPDQLSVKSGLSKDDVFVVVHETHWTETTRLADVVLPASTYLEKTDINLSDHHRYVRLSNQAIEPLEESRHEIWVMQQIADRIGRSESWFHEDPWMALRKGLEGAFENGELGDILKGAVLRLKQKPNDEYQTPSGKIEFYSSGALEKGIEPLPFQMPLGQNDNDFVLLNSSLPKWTQSQFRDVYGPIPEVVWLNSFDAMEIGVHDGEEVTLTNELGELTLKAITTYDITKGVLWSPRPLTDKNGSPLNILASGKPQLIGSGPRFNSIMVKVRPCLNMS